MPKPVAKLADSCGQLLTQVKRQVARHTMQAFDNPVNSLIKPTENLRRTRAVASNNRPILVGSFAHGPSRKGNRSGRPSIQVLPRMFRKQKGRIKANHSRLLYTFQRGIFNLLDSKFATSCEDDMVELASTLREELLDVGLKGRRGKITGISGHTVFGGRIGFQKVVDASFDLGLIRRRDDDRGAGFDGGLGDAVSYATAAANDEDTLAGELGGVFLAVGHG